MRSDFRSLVNSTMIAKMHSEGMMLHECSKSIMQEIQSIVGTSMGFSRDHWPGIFTHMRGNEFYVSFISFMQILTFYFFQKAFRTHMTQRRTDIGRYLTKKFILLRNDVRLAEETVDWARLPCVREHIKEISKSCNKIDILSRHSICWVIAYVRIVVFCINFFLSFHNSIYIYIFIIFV